MWLLLVNSSALSREAGSHACIHRKLGISVGDKLTDHLLWMKIEKTCESTVDSTLSSPMR